MNINMRKINIYFPVAFLERLKALSSKTGAPVSELLRRAAEAYLKEAGV